MKDVLIHSDLMEIRSSPIDGYGVFAKRKIKKNTILEECHFAACSAGGRLKDYYFKYPKDSSNIKRAELFVLPFGFAPLYNSSETAEGSNVSWETNLQHRLFTFASTEDIKKDQEMLTWYGLKWWNFRRRKKK